MKPYEEYQHLPGEPMTERDIKEEHSKFWGEGKWNNFVRPFLPQHPDKEDILIDMGCNAGLFLAIAENMGFNAIGVDSNEGAVQKGLAWRDKNGKNYQIIHSDINACIDDLPVADYTVLANAHYYFTVNDWLEYLDKLQVKTRYCIIVTDEKKHLNRCWASADVDDIRSFFKNWDEIGFIDVMSQDDPSPRKLRSFCFRSRFVDKVPVDTLDASNHVQDGFYGELDSGKSYKETRYYRILVKYRRDWGEERLNKWFEERIKNYKSIKENGLRTPIIVERKLTVQKDKDGNLLPPKYKILDGNHRHSGMRHLGFKNIFVRKI